MLSLDQPGLWRWLDSIPDPTARSHIRRLLSQHVQEKLTLERLMRQVAWLIRSVPETLHVFNDFLPEGHALLFSATHEVLLAVTLSPTGATIHDLHDSFRNLDYPDSSSTLRHLLELESSSGACELFPALQPPLTDCVLQVMQWELDHSFGNRKHRNMCLQYMRKLAKAQGVLPLELYIRNAKREGTHPVTGGGFADIWRGRMGDKPVCLKVLRIFTTDTIKEKIIKEFCHESIVWRQLHHPNVLPFLGVSKELFAPSFCLISPFMENGNILSFLEKNPNHDRVACLNQIAQGLNYLHTESPCIVHGDIRGANILVQDNLVCCLADFGLALVSESQALDSSSGPIRGATRWMGPELIAPRKFEDQVVDATKRDIYAFACTVIEIYTGKSPFPHHRMDSAVIHDVLCGIRPDRPQEPHPIPDDLWDVITECWAELPSSRPTIAQVLPWIRAEPPRKDEDWAEPDLEVNWTEPSWIELVDGWLDAQSVHSQHSRSVSPSRVDSTSAKPSPSVNDNSNSLHTRRDGGHEGNGQASDSQHSYSGPLKRRPAWRRAEIVPDVEYTPPKRPRPHMKTHHRTAAIIQPPSPRAASPEPESAGPSQDEDELAPPRPPFMGHLRRNPSSESNTTTGSSNSSDSRRWGWAPSSDELSSLTSNSPSIPFDEPNSSPQKSTPSGETEYLISPVDILPPRPAPAATHSPQSESEYNGPQISLDDYTPTVISITLQRNGRNPKEWTQFAMIMNSGPAGQRSTRHFRDHEQPVKMVARFGEKGLDPKCHIRHIATIPSPVRFASIKNQARLLTRHNRSVSEDPAQKLTTKLHKRTLSTPSPYCTYAVAIYPVVAEEPGRVDVQVEDRFVVLSKNDACYTVQTDLTGQQENKHTAIEGIVPASCVLQLTVPFAQAISIAAKGNPDFIASNDLSPILPRFIMSASFSGEVLRDFDGRGHGELSVRSGTTLHIYKKYNRWSYVVLPVTGERGWIPSWIVKPCEL